MIRFFIRLLRKILKGIAALLILGSLAVALMQTKWVKNQIRIQLTQELKKQGIDAEIEGIEGRLPFTWTIAAIRLKLPNQEEITLRDCKIRLKILPLFNRQISINYLTIQELDLSWKKEARADAQPLNLSPLALKTDLQRLLRTLSPALHCSIQHLHIAHLTLREQTGQKTYHFTVDARGKWRKDNREFLFDGKLSSPDTAEIYAELFLNGNQQKNKISVGLKTHLETPSWVVPEWHVEILLMGPWTTWQAIVWEDSPPGPPIKGRIKTELASPRFSHFPYLNHPMESTSLLTLYTGGIFTLDTTLHSEGGQELHANLNASVEEGAWQGNLLFSTTPEPYALESRCTFLWSPEKEIHLSDFSFTGADTALHGDLTLDLPSKQITGAFYGQARSLQKLQSWLPFFPLDGNLGIECTLSAHPDLTGEEFEQNLQLHLYSKELRSPYGIGENVVLNATLRNLYHDPSGTLELTTPKLYTSQLFIEDLRLHTYSEDQKWRIDAHVQGALQDPFQIDAQGTWAYRDHAFSIELAQASGEIAQEPFFLEQPTSLHWGPQLAQLSSCALSVGGGSVQGTFEFSPALAQAQFQMTHFPLKTLSLFHPNFTLNGTATASGGLQTEKGELSGFFNGVLEQADLLYPGKELPLQTKGSIQAHLDHQMLQVHSSLFSREGQFLDLACSLPLTTRVFPFSLTIDPKRALSAEGIGEGKIEEIFDFLNIGSHHITGLLSCRLLLSQTLEDPALQGAIDWQFGSYENYSTGTTLKDLNVHLTAEKNQLHMDTLTARDEAGSLTAEGILYLKSSEGFPYELSAELTNLNALRFDMIDAHLTGPLYLTGTTASALALGNLTVPQATIKIPDQLPYEIPSLPVTYIHWPAHLAHSQVSSLPTFPFNLDLELSAEDQVFVEGKGLQSEWKGSVHLTGTNMNVAADGKLDLLNGEYLFTGKIFKLSEGQIAFNDKPTPSAYLKLSGILSLQDVEITAHLYGPLTSPQLTFQSNPHMTTSAILSRILFNKDLSDISQTEAIQLATTLMDLSGGATPGVMEAIRKTLGIDRLTIVPSEKNEIALQIGKYLTKGVLVTLSQSATSTQVIVEVELKEGFVFQAETQEDQEGKFSLKWRRNY